MKGQWVRNGKEGHSENCICYPHSIGAFHLHLPSFQILHDFGMVTSVRCLTVLSFSWKLIALIQLFPSAFAIIFFFVHLTSILECYWIKTEQRVSQQIYQRLIERSADEGRGKSGYTTYGSDSSIAVSLDTSLLQSPQMSNEGCGLDDP